MFCDNSNHEMLQSASFHFRSHNFTKTTEKPLSAKTI